MTVVAAAGVLVALVLARPLSGRRRRSDTRARLGGPAPRARPSPRAGPAVVERALLDADVPVAAATAVRGWALAVAVAALLAGAVAGLGAAGIGAAVVGGTPVLALRLRTGRRDDRVERRLPSVLEAMAAAVRSGAAPGEALHLASAPTGSVALDADLARCRADLDRGGSVVEAVQAWAARRPVPGLRLTAAALALGAETGGARARSLDAVATTLRERAALAREVAALSSQARASATVIIAAPVVFGALGLLSGPGVAGFLFGTPAGLGCLVAGLGLDAAGAVWINRLARPPA